MIALYFKILFLTFVVGTAYSFNMLKDINKGEAYKCLEKAEEYIQKKQYELADKFIIKSKKLFLLPEADGKYINKR